MRYTNGTADTRVRIIRRIDEGKYEPYVKFLRSKDLLISFALETRLSQPQETRFISNEKIELFAEKRNLDGKEYLIYKEPFGFTIIYEVLPNLYNDEIFSWKRNKKYNTLEATFERGTFEFLCICKEDMTVSIDVRYAKCDNRHRNKVTITTIELDNASNKSILEAIEFWKAAFELEVKEIA